ncbi:MAG: helix-turn-helix domain-containing protein [Thermodesulfobacteriota bacterium]|nr:helix-turn-helix domain-containing protein [Thermodesulfobacteriota bacterium]MDQ7839168.1 helix-turn-helix domain-containing protein [Thermodesulfobacteriota bacterium]
MIRTEREYQEAQKRLLGDQEVMAAQRKRMGEIGLSEEDIEMAMEPAVSFHLQLKEEVEWYERVKSGDFQPIEYLNEVGHLLVGLRIYLGLSQKELAGRLGVSEAQVSRDEKNEYHGITLERAQKILEALKAGVELRVKKPSRRCA